MLGGEDFTMPLTLKNKIGMTAKVGVRIAYLIQQSN